MSSGNVKPSFASAERRMLNTRYGALLIDDDCHLDGSRRLSQPRVNAKGLNGR
jgi:hypothetical protein